MWTKSTERRPYKVYNAVAERTYKFKSPTAGSYTAASDDLIAVTLSMAETLQKQNPFLFTVEATNDFTRRLGMNSTESIAADLCVSYFDKKWSRLSDNPNRPTAKAAAPATLDA